MPLYTLKKLIDDCAKKKWKTRRMPKGIPQHERVQIYEEIWMALNLWLRAVMEQGKGGHLPAFGTFCWELDQEASSQKIKGRKPVFTLDDVMKREFGAKPWRRPLTHRILTKHLEMNYTELAIRWSTILTKDLVFSGLRDMMARLRQVIKAGYKLKVRFGVGKLLVKEKRVAFIFDKELRINRNKTSFHTLPASMTVAADSEIGDLLHEASEGGSSFPSSRGSARSNLPPLSKSASAPAFVGSSNDGGSGGSGVPNLDLTGVGNNDAAGGPETGQPDHPTHPEDDPDDEGLALAPTFRSTTSNDVTAFNADRSCVFAVSEKYRGGANPDRLDRAAMRDALALAYERHLIDVEADIADEEQQGKESKMVRWWCPVVGWLVGWWPWWLTTCSCCSFSSSFRFFVSF